MSRSSSSHRAARIARLAAAALALTASLVATSREAEAVVYSHVGDLVEVAQTSPLSFRGRVTAVNYRSIAIAGRVRRQPYTEVTFTVTASYAGGLRVGQAFVLRQMGGRTFENPAIHQVIPGVAEFLPGVEYVVFANDSKHPMEGSRWGEHGVLRIARDVDGTEIALDARRRPLVSDGLGGLLPVSDLRCDRFADAERACAGLISADPRDHDEGDEGDEGPAGPYLRVATEVNPDHLATKADVDAFVRDAVRRRAPVGAPLTNNATRAAFEAALRLRMSRNQL